MRTAIVDDVNYKSIDDSLDNLITRIDRVIEYESRSVSKTYETLLIELVKQTSTNHNEVFEISLDKCKSGIDVYNLVRLVNDGYLTWYKQSREKLEFSLPSNTFEMMNHIIEARKMLELAKVYAGMKKG